MKTVLIILGVIAIIFTFVSISILISVGKIADEDIYDDLDELFSFHDMNGDSDSAEEKRGE